MRLAVYMSGDGTEPAYLIDGREALTPVFADLNRYDVTTHFSGQSTIDLDDGRATGRSHLFHRSSQDENWPAWYASYMAAEQAGSDLPA
jgi:hypothetical protein